MLVLSALYAFGLSIKFHIFKSTVVFHVLLNLTFYILFTIFAAVLLSNRAYISIKRYLIVFVLWLFWWSLILLYLGNFLSLTEWGQMLSYPVVMSVMRDLDHYVESIGLSMMTVVAVVVVLSLVVLLLSYNKGSFSKVENYRTSHYRYGWGGVYVFHILYGDRE